MHEGQLLALAGARAQGRALRAEDLNLLAAFAQITVLALDSAEGHRTIERSIANCRPRSRRSPSSSGASWRCKAS